MSKPTGFHVRHDLQPHLTYELLMLLRSEPVGQTEAALQRVAHAQGFALRQRSNYDKLLKSLEELAIIEKDRQDIALTPLGYVIAEAIQFQRPLLGELIHFLYYTLFDSDPNLRFSWSYRTVCDHLWMTAPAPINRDRLVNLVTQQAMRHWDESSISFSTQSVQGILHWVGSLSPVCLDESGKLFSRRLYCPVETFALALHHVYQRHRGESPSALLTPDIRQSVCQICLIVPEAFYEMLDHAQSSFDAVQVRGERLVMERFSWDLLFI